MKHGPIALLDESTPVVAVATESPVLEKLISNIQEVRARGARVIGDRDRGRREDRRALRRGDPGARDAMDAGSLLAVIPLQLLAYFIAAAAG